jgi:hypothetical protein
LSNARVKWQVRKGLPGKVVYAFFKNNLE